MLLRIYCSVNNWLGDLVAIMLRRRNLAARGNQTGGSAFKRHVDVSEKIQFGSALLDKDEAARAAIGARSWCCALTLAECIW
jgi:hypothetical protein